MTPKETLKVRRHREEDVIPRDPPDPDKERWKPRRNLGHTKSDRTPTANPLKSRVRRVRGEIQVRYRRTLNKPISRKGQIGEEKWLPYDTAVELRSEGVVEWLMSQ